MLNRTHACIPAKKTYAAYGEQILCIDIFSRPTISGQAGTCLLNGKASSNTFTMVCSCQCRWVRHYSRCESFRASPVGQLLALNSSLRLSQTVISVYAYVYRNSKERSPLFRAWKITPLLVEIDKNIKNAETLNIRKDLEA